MREALGGGGGGTNITTTIIIEGGVGTPTSGGTQDDDEERGDIIGESFNEMATQWALDQQRPGGVLEGSGQRRA